MAVGWREGKIVVNSKQRDQEAKAWELRKGIEEGWFHESRNYIQHVSPKLGKCS